MTTIQFGPLTLRLTVRPLPKPVRPAAEPLHVVARREQQLEAVQWLATCLITSGLLLLIAHLWAPANALPWLLFASGVCGASGWFGFREFWPHDERDPGDEQPATPDGH